MWAPAPAVYTPAMLRPQGLPGSPQPSHKSCSLVIGSYCNDPVSSWLGGWGSSKTNLKPYTMARREHGMRPDSSQTPGPGPFSGWDPQTRPEGASLPRAVSRGWPVPLTPGRTHLLRLGPQSGPLGDGGARCLPAGHARHSPDPRPTQLIRALYTVCLEATETRCQEPRQNVPNPWSRC